jgi:amidohydrolase
MNEWAQEIDRFVDSVAAELRDVRRHLHQNPEPSGEEYETTKFLAHQLKQAGIEVRIAATRRGLFADGQATTSLPRVAMRGDMDALHIHEQNQVEYRSRRDGIMHACGHDAHSTIILAAARALKQVEASLPWPCPWRAIFEAAEETGAGAQEMIQAGAMDGVRSVITLHVDPDRLVGRVGLRHGAMTAACQDIDVRIRGKGGHAARPHESNDPIAAAAQFINEVYRFVPRMVDSRNPVVVTIGVIHGGELPNVIPDQVLLRGTIRTLTRASREEVKSLLDRIRRGISEITGTSIDFTFDEGIDGVHNDEGIADAMWQAAAEVVGPDNVEQIPQPSMGAEDFANYLGRAPGCLLRLGVATEGRPRFDLHSPSFDLDEQALAIGAKILARTLVLLSRPTYHS